MTKHEAIETAIKTIDEVVNATGWTTTISDLITTQERLKELLAEINTANWTDVGEDQRNSQAKSRDEAYNNITEVLQLVANTSLSKKEKQGIVEDAFVYAKYMSYNAKARTLRAIRQIMG